MTDSNIENKVMDGDKLIDEALSGITNDKEVIEPEAQEDDVEEQEEAVDTEAQEDDSKPKGYDPVDLNTLPPEMRGPVRDRINHLYKQTKRTDEKNHYLSRQNEELSRTLQEVLEKIERNEAKEQTKELSEAKEVLFSKYEQAALNEDHRAMAQISAEIAKIDLQQPVKEKQEVKQPQKQQSSTFTEDDIAYVEELASGADGKQRPWLSSSNLDLYQQAQAEGARISREYAAAYGRQPSIGKLMLELDKSMSRIVNPQPIRGGGLSGSAGADLTKTRNNTKLTDRDRETLAKLGVPSSQYEKNQNLLKNARSRIVSIEDF